MAVQLVRVEGTGHGDALTLATGQVDAALAHLRLIAGRPQQQVLVQRTRPDRAVVSARWVGVGFRQVKMGLDGSG